MIIVAGGSGVGGVDFVVILEPLVLFVSEVVAVILTVRLGSVRARGA